MTSVAELQVLSMISSQSWIQGVNVVFGSVLKQVPASVRVRRENAPKFKPKPAPQVTAAQVPTSVPRPNTGVVTPVTIDDTYSAFLEDMKLLGAFGEGQEADM